MAKLEDEERLQLVIPDYEDESGQESSSKEGKSSNGPVNYSSRQ